MRTAFSHVYPEDEPLQYAVENYTTALQNLRELTDQDSITNGELALFHRYKKRVELYFKEYDDRMRCLRE